MPKISQFLGISIYMYFDDHAPPHFHALYGGQEAAISIRDLSVLHGTLAPRVLGLVLEWAALHRLELAEAWRRVENGRSPGRIEPLA
jgi:hypothetical protein